MRHLPTNGTGQFDQRNCHRRSQGRDPKIQCGCNVFASELSSSRYSPSRSRGMAPTNLSLKQRLAALATATSSPTAPYDAPQKSPGADRRRAFFNPTWIKRPSVDGSLFGGEASRDPANDKLQEVMGRVIYQAGVDFEWVYCLFRRR